MYSPIYISLKFNPFELNNIEENLKKSFPHVTLLGIKQSNHITLFLHLSLYDLKRYIQYLEVFEIPLTFCERPYYDVPFHINETVISTAIISSGYHQFKEIKDILNYINDIEEKMTSEERLMDFLARPFTNINNLEPFYKESDDD